MEVILYLAYDFFRIYIICVRYISLFLEDCRIDKKLMLIFVSIYTIINSILYFIFDNSVLSVLSDVILFCIMTFVYKGKVSAKIFCIVIVSIINMLYEEISHIITKYLTSDIIFSKIIIYLITIFSLYITEQILSRIFNKGKFCNLDLKYFLILLIIPTGSLYLYINILTIYKSRFMCFLSGIILIFINVSIFYIFNEISKSYKKKHSDGILEMENIYYKNQLDILKKSEEKTAKVRHDYKNHILVIKGYITEGDIENAKIYLNTIISDIKIENRLVNSGNIVVDSLFNYKLGNIKDINYNFKIMIPEKLFMSEYHFNIILGNMLDNALEALNKCTDKYLDVVLKYSRDILYIRFKNNYNGAILKRNNKFFTTKEDKNNHGYGIKNIKEIVNFYNGDIDFDIDDNFFEINIVLYGKPV